MGTPPEEGKACSLTHVKRVFEKGYPRYSLPLRDNKNAEF
jgi:hypothetical protein